MKVVKDANRFSDLHQNDSTSLLTLAHRLESFKLGTFRPVRPVFFEAVINLPAPVPIAYRRINE